MYFLPVERIYFPSELIYIWTNIKVPDGYQILHFRFLDKPIKTLRWKCSSCSITENDYLGYIKNVDRERIITIDDQCVLRLESRTSFKYNKTDSLHCLPLYQFYILFTIFSLSLGIPSLFFSYSLLISPTFPLVIMLPSQLYFRPPTWYIFRSGACYHGERRCSCSCYHIIILVVDVDVVILSNEL